MNYKGIISSSSLFRIFSVFLIYFLSLDLSFAFFSSIRQVELLNISRYIDNSSFFFFFFFFLFSSSLIFIIMNTFSSWTSKDYWWRRAERPSVFRILFGRTRESSIFQLTRVFFVDTKCLRDSGKLCGDLPGSGSNVSKHRILCELWYFARIQSLEVEDN